MNNQLDLVVLDVYKRQGKMTMRYIGGGHRKVIRIVDFKRNKDGVPAVVKRCV